MAATPYVPFSFVTTAARIAYTFGPHDVGRLVQDQENGNYYWVVVSGAGAGTMTPLQSLQGSVQLSLHSFREITSGGAVGNIAANGGILASDTTPVMGVDASESTTILWAASNSDLIGTQIALPADFDGTRDVTVQLTAASGGTTNACTFTVETSWDSGTVVVDTCTGAATATVATYSATIAAADVPDTASRLTLELTPAAHTTDTMILLAAKLRYYRV